MLRHGVLSRGNEADPGGCRRVNPSMYGVNLRTLLVRTHRSDQDERFPFACAVTLHVVHPEVSG